MREFLRDEFPDVSSAAARIPRPTLAPTTPLWGFLAALGGALVAGSIALTLSAIARESLDTLWTDAPFLPFFLPFQVSEFTGGLAAAAIARAAGGRRALLLFLGYELCSLLIGFARAQLAQTELFGPFDPLAFVERQIPGSAPTTGRWSVRRRSSRSATAVRRCPPASARTCRWHSGNRALPSAVGVA